MDHKTAIGGVTRRAFGAGAMALSLIGGRAVAQTPTGIPILRIVQSGHSLTDGVIEPLNTMISAAGGRGTTLVKSTIPGSPMEWRWNNDPGYGQPFLSQPEAMAPFDLMVITERVALSTTLPYHASDDYALRWFNQAWTYGKEGKGAASILFASWVDIQSGPGFEVHGDPDSTMPLRDRLPHEMAMWEQILDHVNDNRPTGAPPMKMIPGPLIMAAAYDQIAAGTAPGLTEFSQLFRDTIHTSEFGNYLIALAHFAVIYNRAPHGLPAGVPAHGGVSREQAAWMQDIVWQVVSSYPRAMTDGSGKLDY